MRRIITGVPVFVVIAGAFFITQWVVEDRNAAKRPVPGIATAQKIPASRMPEPKGLKGKDRQLAEQVFKSPEKLDAMDATSVPGNAVESGASGSAYLLSETEPVQPPEEGLRDTETNPPYFHNDFASLRTDAVRNPDSLENRATVNALMLKRQQRLAKESL